MLYRKNNVDESYCKRFLYDYIKNVIVNRRNVSNLHNVLASMCDKCIINK